MCPRIARVIVPNVPHHIVARGNRRQQTFFKEEDYVRYLYYLEKYTKKLNIKIAAYCLMSNHVHFIAWPPEKDSFACLFNEVQRRYSRDINREKSWRGHLWQGRYASYAMDEGYLYHAIRYVERNPVSAGLIALPEEYKWSSARVRIYNVSDPIVEKNFLRNYVEDWKVYLHAPTKKEIEQKIALHYKTGRPLGSKAFLHKLEQQTGRQLIPKKRGRKFKKQ
ncbi:transposase [bacterium]|nr:transposase [bacterium]